MLYWLTIVLSGLTVLTILVGTAAGICLDIYRPQHSKSRKQRYLWPCYFCAMLVVFLGIWSSFSRIEIRLAFGEHHGVSALMVKGMVKGMVNFGWFSTMRG